MMMQRLPQAIFTLLYTNSLLKILNPNLRAADTAADTAMAEERLMMLLKVGVGVLIVVVVVVMMMMLQLLVVLLLLTAVY
jgi:hypothetical protein